MAFLVKANPARMGTLSQVMNDRVEALRLGLNLESMGYRHVQIVEGDTVYTLQEFAGTLMIGEKHPKGSSQPPVGRPCEIKKVKDREEQQ